MSRGGSFLGSLSLEHLMRLDTPSMSTPRLQPPLAIDNLISLFIRASVF